MNFPQYRKMSNGKSYYCIQSENQYSEVKVWGKYYEEFEFTVHQYNDKLLIQELLNGAQFTPMDQSTYEMELSRIRNEFEKI